MPDLADFFRWQWLWRSRRRLFVIGLVVFLLGVALLVLLIATWLWGPPNGNIARGIPAPVILMALGGYGMLQATFSGGGAFGDHDRPLPKTLPPAKRTRRRGAEDDARPLPLAETAETVTLTTTRCPACEETVTAAATECPMCFQRLVPK